MKTQGGKPAALLASEISLKPTLNDSCEATSSNQDFGTDDNDDTISKDEGDVEEVPTHHPARKSQANAQTPTSRWRPYTRYRNRRCLKPVTDEDLRAMARFVSKQNGQPHGTRYWKSFAGDPQVCRCYSQLSSCHDVAENFSIHPFECGWE